MVHVRYLPLLRLMLALVCLCVSVRAQATPADPYLFYAEEYGPDVGIYKQNLTTMVTAKISAMPRVTSLALDPTNDHLYVARQDSVTLESEIVRMDLEAGNEFILVNNLGTDPIYGMALNIPTQHIYFTVYNASTSIRRINFDGTNMVDVVPSLFFPHGIDIDRVHSKLYFVEYGPGDIKRANLDGSSVETIVNKSDWEIAGIAVNTLENKIYYGPYGTGDAYQANLDGSNENTIIYGFDGAPVLRVHPPTAQMYYFEVNNGFRVSRSSTDGVTQQTLHNITGSAMALDVSEGLNFPSDPTATATVTPTAAPTNTPTPRPTHTPTATPTTLPTTTPTDTPTESPTDTPTRTPTGTPTWTPTSTQVPTTPTPSVPSGTLEVTILDPDGLPLSGAVVAISRAGSFISNLEGNVIVTRFPSTVEVGATLTIRVVKDGYVFPTASVRRGEKKTVRAPLSTAAKTASCSIRDFSPIRAEISKNLTALYLNTYEALDEAQKRSSIADSRAFEREFKNYQKTVASLIKTVQRIELKVPTQSVKCSRSTARCADVSLQPLLRQLASAGRVYVDVTSKSVRLMAGQKVETRPSIYISRARALKKALSKAMASMPTSAGRCS